MDTIPGGAHYWDLGLQEGHVRLVYHAVDETGAVLQERNVLLQIPEKVMDDLEKLIGDGNATITVGKEIKVSEDYKTAGSSAYIKLTCNQDIKTILEAREIANTLVLAFAQQGYEQAQYTLDRLLGKDTNPPEPLRIQVVEETDNKIPSKEQDPEPLRKQRQGIGPRPILKNKPNFRR
jgi:hypothetical protein